MMQNREPNREQQKVTTQLFKHLVLVYATNENYIQLSDTNSLLENLVKNLVFHFYKKTKLYSTLMIFVLGAYFKKNIQIHAILTWNASSKFGIVFNVVNSASKDENLMYILRNSKDYVFFVTRHL